MFKRFLRAWRSNPFDSLLMRAQKRGANRFLLCWNRGLGDIALGMYALVHRIREQVPDAHITLLTRADLAEGFSLLKGVVILTDPHMRRKEPFDIVASLSQHHLQPADFDVVIEKPDPTYWCKWQLGTLIPRLCWNAAWEDLTAAFPLTARKRYLGVHVQTETSYGYEKNWPLTSWRVFFEKVTKDMGIEVILFGNAPTPSFEMPGIIDLRGKTSLAAMLAIIKCHCAWLVVPDSGVLSLTYFLDVSFPLKIVSLWADPCQGVLKQNVPSPNPKLTHIPLIAPEGKLSLVAVEQVMEALSFTYSSSMRKRQQEALKQAGTPLPLSPLSHYAIAGNADDAARGERIVAEGKAACIVLAGGQGTRLGHPGPKGTIPVSPVKGKSLFQLLAERIVRASEKAGRPLSLALMTSPLNDAETRHFFEQNNFFGLTPEQISFFPQPVLPFCDDNGEWLFDETGDLVVGPDGNGHVFHTLAERGIWDKWRAQGVEFVSVIPIDNPLADPFDLELIGFHQRQEGDVVLKAVEREHSQDNMGVVALIDGKIRVVEYTELCPEDSSCLDTTGELRYKIANASLFCFHAPFIQKVVDARVEMPLHLARKPLSGSLEEKAWKFETFIFDLLVHAHHPTVLLYPRHQVYAPLKNATGDKSVDTVRAALKAIDVE